MLAAVLYSLALAAPIAASPVHVEDRSLHKRWSNCWGYNPEGCPFPTQGKHGAVACEVGTCSAIGVQVLKEGGNAADAMIASALCVGTIAGFHSGIGGGGFMVVRYNNKDGSTGYEQIDFRETAPAASNETMFSQYGTNQTKSTIGGLAVGVPGELRGWEMLHKRHGSMPWAKLFEPAIGVARNGFPVNRDLAPYLQDRKFITDEPVWAESFAKDGKPLKEGDMVYRHKFADTLQRIADEGPDVFYKDSSIADNIVKATQEAGGIITHEDLAGYKVILRNTSTIEYRGKNIHGTTAPSSGAIVLSALKIFGGWDGSAADTDPEINVTTHRLIQATRFAYGQRATLGDPAFTKNVSSLEASYITEEIAAKAREQLKDEATFPITYYNPSNYYPTREGGTSHLAVVDDSGMAISLTTTVNLIWGSTVMTADGIVLNNEMDDFSQPGSVNAFGFAANPINFVQPGKRPQSSIASSLVEDGETGELLMATGSAGGSRIITATLQELYHYIDQNLNATECTGHPRWHDQLGGQTFFDWAYPGHSPELQGYDNSTVAFLGGLGYNISYQDPTATSTSHALGRLPNGEWLAGADPRKGASYGQAY